MGGKEVQTSIPPNTSRAVRFEAIVGREPLAITVTPDDVAFKGAVIAGGQGTGAVLRAVVWGNV